MNEEKKKNFKYVKTGLFAGIASSASIFSYPLEVLKIRFQVIENKKFTKKVITNMFREEGIKSFYKGLTQNLLHGFIGYGTVFFFYNIFYDKLNNFEKTKNYKTLN